jgi:hypothetical protein
MSYALRPADKLKLPGWLKSDLESGGHTVNPRELKISPTQDNGSDNSANNVDGRPYSLFDLPLTSDPASLPPATLSTATPANCTPKTKKSKMARVKHLHTRNTPVDPADRNLRGDATDRAVTRPADLPDNTVPSNVTAAAFPSLLTTTPISEPAGGHIGVKQRLDAMDKHQDLLLQATLRAVDLMYDVERIPASLPDKQKAWYTELKTRWLPNEHDVPVCHSMPLHMAFTVCMLTGL